MDVQKNTPAINRYPAIEGLRGYLAWAVVIAHCIQYLGLDRQSKSWGLLSVPGAFWAVPVFIIVSGFVIAHLVTSKAEPYPAYIAQRALRIVPIYYVGLALGAFTTFAIAPVLSELPWADAPGFNQDAVYAAHVAELNTNAAYWHWAAHLTLFHGLIPQEVLPNAAFMFLSPAWSLSTEWQFYIVAPLFVAALTKAGTRGVVLVTLAVWALASKFHVFGHYDSALSTIVAAGPYFLVGIATHTVWRGLPGRSLPGFPSMAVPVIACGAILWPDAAPLFIWFAVVAAMRPMYDESPGPTRYVLRKLLESWPVRWLGTRSYSTYILHMPIIHLVMLAQARAQPPALWGSVDQAIVVVGVLCATLVASALGYALIEQPFMQLARATGANAHFSQRARRARNAPA